MFYYSGPFSYNGLVVFWVPGVSFFVWVSVLAFVQVRGWDRVRGIPVAGPDSVKVDAPLPGDGMSTGVLESAAYVDASRPQA